MKREIAIGCLLAGTMMSATAQDDSTAEIERLQARVAEITKTIGEATGKRNARVEEIRKSDAAAEVDGAVQEALAAYNNFYQTDPEIQELRQRRDEAQRNIAVVRNRVAHEHEEGAANRAEVEELAQEILKLNNDIYMADRVYDGTIRAALLNENEAIADATKAVNDAMEARTRRVNGSEELKTLRSERDLARLAWEIERTKAFQAEEIKAADEALREAEQACRTLYDDHELNQAYLKAHRSYEEVLQQALEKDEGATEVIARIEAATKKIRAIANQRQDLRATFGKLHRIADDNAELADAQARHYRARDAFNAAKHKVNDTAVAMKERDRAQWIWTEMSQAEDVGDEEMGAAYKAYRAAGAAYRAKVKEMDENPAVVEARKAYEEARDNETEVRAAKRAEHPDVKAVQDEIDALDKETAELNWQLRLLQYKRDSWFKPQGSRDPEVQQAAVERSLASSARSKINDAAAVRAAMEARDAAKKKADQLRAEIDAGEAVAELQKAYDEKRLAADKLYAELMADEVLDEAQKAKADVSKKVLDDDEDVQEHRASQDAVRAEIREAQARTAELNREWGDLLRSLDREDDEVKEAIDAYNQGVAAYNEGTRQDEPVRLAKELNEARAAYNAKVKELAEADEVAAAAAAKIAELSALRNEVNGELKALLAEKAAKEKDPAGAAID